MLRWSFIGRSLFLIISLVAAMQFSPSAIAQDEAASARKFDEFEGSLGGCDYGARLDNFVIELQNNPEVEGYIICYGPGGESSTSVNLRLDAAKDYLVNLRALDAARVKTLYGGRSKELKVVFTEFWVVPHGASPPDLVSYENDVKTFSGLFAEYKYWEGPYEGNGPPQGNFTVAGLADVLREQPETLTYVVVQNAKGATPGAWRRAAKEVVADLQAGYKIHAERIKITYAGYDAGDTEDHPGDAKVQLWVVPKDAPPPVAEVTEPEPTPDEAVQWRTFSAYDLEDASDKRRVFEGFADVLRNDKGVSVYIIVREKSTALEITEQTSDAEFTQNLKYQEPKIDLMDLAGNWRSDLAKEHGISEQRFILLKAPPQEWQGTGMEIWVVPTGGALPDPYGENADETDEEDEGDDAQQEISEAEPPG